MKTTTHSELKQRATDVFSFILLWCPDFPPQTKTTVAREFDELAELIGALMDGTRSEDGKQWLRTSLQEVDQSRKRYEGGDSDKGRDLIQRAEQHFRNAFAKKMIAPRFIVGGSGPAHDIDAGFPS